MNDTTSALDQAIEMASLGYRIIPIPPGQKYPKGISEWQKKATADEATVADWWGKLPDHGIGWAMGRQPNGEFVFAIDVDDWDAFDAWAAEAGFDVEGHPVAVAFDATCTSRTGRGGGHFIFTTDDEEVTNGYVVKGVDIRGEGGFIVIPPTTHPNGNNYEWVQHPRDGIMAAPLVLLDQMTPEQTKTPGQEGAGGLRPQEVSSRLGARDNDEDTPADWVRRELGINRQLFEAGWMQSHTKGNEVYWVRPGKNPRDGHSAVCHDDQVLNVFSTEVLWTGGRQGAAGLTSYSPLQVFANLRCEGDIKGAARVVRKELMPPEPRPVVGERGGHGYVGDPAEIETPGTDPTILGLPDEFWEARPELDHIRRAALSKLVAPDALLGSYLARVAAMVPPKVRLPAIVGTEATFDYMTCIVAKSAGGKSVSNGASRDLIAYPPKQVNFDAPVGSGEGLVQAFMGRELDDKGKPTGDPSYKYGTHKSIHLTVDEGKALMEMGKRRGSTIVPTLVSAWSGATLGQLNASEDTKRLVPGRERRVAATINMQVANGWLLWEDASLGFVSRTLFFTANCRFPDELPDHPGHLPRYGHTTWDTFEPIIVEIEQQIIDEIVAHRRAVAEGRIELTDEDGHNMLARLKTAGLLAFMNGRDFVNMEDWALAGHIVDASQRIKAHLKETKVEHDRSINEANARRRGHGKAIEAETTATALHDRAVEAWLRAIEKHGPGTKKELKGFVRPQYRKADVANPAIEELIRDGVIRRDGAFLQGGR